MKYKNNIMKLAVLTGIMMLGMGQGVYAQESSDSVNIEDLFYTYSSDRQIYDYTEPAYLYGWTSQLEYKNYSG